MRQESRKHRHPEQFQDKKMPTVQLLTDLAWLELVTYILHTYQTVHPVSPAVACG